MKLGKFSLLIVLLFMLMGKSPVNAVICEGNIYIVYNKKNCVSCFYKIHDYLHKSFPDSIFKTVYIVNTIDGENIISQKVFKKSFSQSAPYYSNFLFKSDSLSCLSTIDLEIEPTPFIIVFKNGLIKKLPLSELYKGDNIDTTSLFNVIKR